MLKNMKLAMKIGAGFGLLIIIAMALGAVAIINAHKVKVEATDLADESVPAVAVANNVERHSLLVMYAIRGYAFTEDPAFLEEGNKEFKLVEQYLQEAFALAEKHGAGLAFLKEAAQKAEAKVKEYGELMTQTKTLVDSMDKFRGAMNTAAAEFVQECSAYLKSQADKQKEEFAIAGIEQAKLADRAGKVTGINDVIDFGNAIRVASWKAQTERDPKIVEAVMPNFEKIEKLLDTLRSHTTQDANLRQLEKVEDSAQSYKKALEGLVKDWNLLQEVNKKRTATAFEVLAAAESTAKLGMESTAGAAQEAVTALDQSSRILIMGLSLAAVIGLILAIFITRSITKPVILAVDAVQKIAKGDMTQQLAIDQKDEIGQLAMAMNSMATSLRALMKELTQNSVTLASASEELSATSTQLSSNAEEMSAQSRSVATAGEQLSSNVNTMAAAAEEMSSSSASVAAAIEEMSTSINEVAKNCEKEAKIAKQANSQAGSTRQIMGKLGDSAREIGKVVEVISGIADQTNLLALNATIEAASAGEAGKGFAVVANEVKELARQSAQATEQIARQIQDMQSNTETAVKAIEEITKIIEEVTNISGSIAAAVEEQSATTNEIAKNVANVSAGTNEMAKNVQESAKGANEVSKNIQGVNQASQQVASGATQTNASAQELAKIAARLKEMVAQFKV